MIDAVNVGFAVSGRTLVTDANIALRPGELTVVIGPNGAGKSTLFKMLTGELRPTSGVVRLGERDLTTVSAPELALVRAVVPQQTMLSFPFTALEVATLGITVSGLMAPGAQARNLARRMLSRVSVAHLAEQLYPTLSGGERQRVQLARALAQLEAIPDRPGVRTLLVDEPTASLDIAHQLAVLGELKRQAALGRAVFAVLHDINLAAHYGDRLVLIVEGHIVAQGAPRDVLSTEGLSAAYGCRVQLDTLPANGGLYVLPQACSLELPTAAT